MGVRLPVEIGGHSMVGSLDEDFDDDDEDFDDEDFDDDEGAVAWAGVSVVTLRSDSQWSAINAYVMPIRPGEELVEEAGFDHSEWSVDVKVFATEQEAEAWTGVEIASHHANWFRITTRSGGKATSRGRIQRWLGSR